MIWTQPCIITTHLSINHDSWRLHNSIYLILFSLSFFRSTLTVPLYSLIFRSFHPFLAFSFTLSFIINFSTKMFHHPSLFVFSNMQHLRQEFIRGRTFGRIVLQHITNHSQNRSDSLPSRINGIPWNISWKHRVQRNGLDEWKRREIYLSLILSLSLYIPYSFEVFASEQAPLRSEYPVLVHYQWSILRLIMLTSCSASDTSETNNGVPEKISAMTVTHSRFPSVPQPNDQISIAVPYRVAPISNSGALLIRHAWFANR